MQRLSAITVLACVTMAGSSAVHAADIIVEEPPIYIEEAPPVYAAAPDYTGWYLRADAGYVFESETSGDYLFYDGHDYSDRYYYDSIRLEKAFSVGVGAGYRFARHFRADATVDFFKSDVKGRSDCAFQVRGGDDDCYYDDSSQADVWTAMANAYVDLPYFGPVTPYFGAGLGFAHVSYDEMENNVVCSWDHGCPAEGFVGHHKGYDSWRFASALMVGASVDITKQLKLDAGYKYTRIWDGDAFGFDEFDTDNGASGVQGRDHGFDIHTVRAGLRYEFGGGGGGLGKGKGPDPLYAGAPIYASEPIYK